MDNIQSKLTEKILKTIYQLYPQTTLSVKGDFVEISVPKEFSFGDMSTSVSLKLAKIVKQNPMIVASSIVKNLGNLKNLGISKVEIKSPGFINFFVNTEIIISQVNQLLDSPMDYGKTKIDVKTLEKFLKKQTNSIKLGQPNEKIRIMFEFGHPNTHKEMHIGHLRNLIVGESLIRLLNNLGIEIIRVNYEGDVGMHIAKCIWAILKNKQISISDRQKKSVIEKVQFLGKAYVEGNKAYEENEDAKKEIIGINRKIYAKDPSVFELWRETRQWSLDYFETIYKRVYTTFDRYYFESEVFEPGKKIVEENIGKVFQKSQGAIIFPGDKYGLHNRVFITKEAFATYEGKEMGLGKLQFSEYNPDFIIHNVGPEQAEYFKVVFKALEIIFPNTKGKELHHIYGWVQLKEGKMSSRKGNVVSARWLLDEAEKYSEKLITKPDYTENEKADISKKVAVGAIKYSFLRFSSKSDISFSFSESVSLEGDCGPYIMYTFARTQSVLRKVTSNKSQVTSLKYTNLNKEELNLLRLIYKYTEVCFEAGLNFAPNVMTRYLFDLAQAYNLFYNKHQILNAQDSEKEFRLALNSAVGEIIKKGLYLLGIETVEKM